MQKNPKVPQQIIIESSKQQSFIFDQQVREQEQQKLQLEQEQEKEDQTKLNLQKQKNEEQRVRQKMGSINTRKVEIFKELEKSWQKGKMFFQGYYPQKQDLARIIKIENLGGNLRDKLINNRNSIQEAFHQKYPEAYYHWSMGISDHKQAQPHITYSCTSSIYHCSASITYSYNLQQNCYYVQACQNYHKHIFKTQAPSQSLQKLQLVEAGQQANNINYYLRKKEEIERRRYLKSHYRHKLDVEVKEEEEFIEGLSRHVGFYRREKLEYLKKSKCIQIGQKRIVKCYYPQLADLQKIHKFSQMPLSTLLSLISKTVTISCQQKHPNSYFFWKVSCPTATPASTNSSSASTSSVSTNSNNNRSKKKKNKQPTIRLYCNSCMYKCRAFLRYEFNQIESVYYLVGYENLHKHILRKNTSASK